MKQADHPIVVLEKRRARARAYQQQHHRGRRIGAKNGATDTGLYAPVPRRPCPPPHICAGIDPAQLTAGRARPARTRPQGERHDADF